MQTKELKLSSLQLAKYDTFQGSTLTYPNKKEKASIHYVNSRNGNLHIFDEKKWVCIEGFAANT